ncbi:MAG: PorT family protein [Saprospiraceae bacterium]|nr:PorT family protein [Saprospiraceae bacterium]
MKKNVNAGLVLGLILIAANAFGQSKGNVRPVESHLDLAINLVRTNFNYGKSNSVLADYKRSVLSPQVGVSMQAGVTSYFSLIPEFYFMMKGGILEANNSLTEGKTTLRLYTLELPVLARFHYNKFYINAGPSMAYNLHGTNKIDDTTSDLEFNNSSEGFKRWEAGVQFGGGCHFRIKQRQVALDLRYNYGLTNISNTNERYNRSFILSLHFYKPWKTNPLQRNKNS